MSKIVVNTICQHCGGTKTVSPRNFTRLRLFEIPLCDHCNSAYTKQEERLREEKV